MSEFLYLDFLNHETNLPVSFHPLNSFFLCPFLEGKMHVTFLGIHIFPVTGSYPFPNIHVFPLHEVTPGVF